MTRNQTTGPPRDDDPHKSVGGRPAITDRAALVAAAREIGLAHVTVTSVMRHVGAQHSTFYRYFSGIDALLAAVADDACRDLPLPDPEQPWQT